MLDERADVGRCAFLALGAGTLLSGCVQGGTPGGRETTRTTVPQGDSLPSTADGETKTAGVDRTETTTTNRPETKPTTTDRGGAIIGIGSDWDEPQATVTIGREESEREQPEDRILVWNNATTARRITVTVSKRGVSDEPLFQKTYRFEPDAYVEIDVNTPGKYVVSVAVDGDEPATVDFMADDCNYQILPITVKPNGSVRSSDMSTDMMCATMPITTGSDE